MKLDRRASLSPTPLKRPRVVPSLLPQYDWRASGAAYHWQPCLTQTRSHLRVFKSTSGSETDAIKDSDN